VWRVMFVFITLAAHIPETGGGRSMHCLCSRLRGRRCRRGQGSKTFQPAVPPRKQLSARKGPSKASRPPAACPRSAQGKCIGPAWPGNGQMSLDRVDFLFKRTRHRGPCRLRGGPASGRPPQGRPGRSPLGSPSCPRRSRRPMRGHCRPLCERGTPSTCPRTFCVFARVLVWKTSLRRRPRLHPAPPRPHGSPIKNWSSRTNSNSPSEGASPAFPPMHPLHRRPRR